MASHNTIGSGSAPASSASSCLHITGVRRQACCRRAACSLPVQTGCRWPGKSPCTPRSPSPFCPLCRAGVLRTVESEQGGCIHTWVRTCRARRMLASAPLQRETDERNGLEDATAPNPLLVWHSASVVPAGTHNGACTPSYNHHRDTPAMSVLVLVLVLVLAMRTCVE